MIQWEMIAPMVVAIVLILTTGGVILLRPLSRRLADLLEAMTRERQLPGAPADLERLRDGMEAVAARVALLEERQEFTEALMRSPARGSIGVPPGAPPA